MSQWTYTLKDEITGSITEHIGGKGASLYLMGRQGLNVPAPFFISTKSFFDFYKHTNVEKRIWELSHEEIEKQFIRVGLPSDVWENIRSQYKTLNSKWVAVRSSAQIEDSEQYSFAGLLSSYLFIQNEDQLRESILKCFASFFTDRAKTYMKENKLAYDNYGVAVVVQPMVNADLSGIMFTANPVTSMRSELVIDAVYGIGEGIVSGHLDPDHWVLDKKELKIKEERLTDKPMALVFDEKRGQGLKETPITGDKVRNNVFAGEKENILKRIAGEGKRIEAFYGKPMDIEWAMAKDILYILQARPITHLIPDKNILIWDNSNIIESYSGVTTPMTFSFASKAYHAVYREFLRIMGIPQDAIDRIDHLLANMLGLIEGRIYYNLLNWYNLILQLPGFKYNQSFMEQMMGVKESLPDYAQTLLTLDIGKPTLYERVFKIKSGLRTVYNFLTFKSAVIRFTRNFNVIYNAAFKTEYDKMDLVDLLASYRKLESVLLKQWSAPIVNDFFCMVFFGTLKKLCAKWVPGNPNLHNDLLSGEGNIESTEPTKMLMRMALKIKGRPQFVELLGISDNNEIITRIRHVSDYAELKADVELYLEKFGFRCMNELKLESPDLHMNPGFLISMIKNYLNTPDLSLSSMEERETAIRMSAENDAFPRLSLLRKPIFKFVLANARLAVKNRENLRFLRTKIFGVLRRILNASGGYMAREGMIEEQSDVFYFTLNELFSLVEGTMPHKDFKKLIALRKSEFKTYEIEEPDDRIVTRNIVYHRNEFKTRKAFVSTDPNKLVGVSCSPGKVSGRVKVIKSPQDDITLNGEILVTSRTDPGWVPLYPSASALLIERGSLLSHSAIVARELGLPAIVGITGLIERLKTGDYVTVDATNGIVYIGGENGHQEV